MINLYRQQIFKGRKKIKEEIKQVSKNKKMNYGGVIEEVKKLISTKNNYAKM